MRRKLTRASVAKGDGIRPAGKQTAARIIEAADALLRKEGYAEFSMRNVAAAAGLHLNNVQYYFPTRNDLVRGLMRHIGARYQDAYAACLAAAPPDPVVRLRRIVGFNLRDSSDPDTRRLFMQLWALLNTMDAKSGHLLDELYDIDLTQLSEIIREVAPRAGRAEVRRRATVLAAMIEGFVVVCTANGGTRAETKRVLAMAEATGVQIALGHVAGECPGSPT